MTGAVALGVIGVALVLRAGVAPESTTVAIGRSTPTTALSEAADAPSAPAPTPPPGQKGAAPSGSRSGGAPVTVTTVDVVPPAPTVAVGPSLSAPGQGQPTLGGLLGDVGDTLLSPTTTVSAGCASGPEVSVMVAGSSPTPTSTRLCVRVGTVIRVALGVPERGSWLGPTSEDGNVLLQVLSQQNADGSATGDFRAASPGRATLVGLVSEASSPSSPERRWTADVTVVP